MDPARTEEHEARQRRAAFYGPADELPPGALEALRRRTTEQLQDAADRATRRS